MKWKGPRKRTSKLPGKFSKKDNEFMAAAMRLAGVGLGRVWPNPAVGCVLVKNNKIIAKGATQPGGRPHAEFEALQMAGNKAKGATAYVTLEPCAHEGETPSCARLLAEAGVKRVVYATSDPDSRTAGKGALSLAKAGVKVESGLREDGAIELNRGHALRKTQNRPLVTMKIATSNDGKIAKEAGKRTFITGQKAKVFTHSLRGINDAILVGIGTVLADNPDLTCRIPGMEEFSPVRIVMDTNLSISMGTSLALSARDVPVWVVTEQTKIPPDLAKSGIEILIVKDIKNIKQVLEIIAKKGITRLLVEGGSLINSSFLKSGLVDDIYWFTAKKMKIGPQGVPVVWGADIKSPKDLVEFTKDHDLELGRDIVEIFRRID